MSERLEPRGADTGPHRAGEGEDHLTRSAQLIERLLGDPELRRSFRADPAAVLREQGLSDLAAGLGRGERALLTLELRESRSSLAGVMVAAAAEGVDFTHLAERAAPGIEHGAGQELDRLVDGSGPARHGARPAAVAPAAATPKPPSLGSDAQIPSLASPPAVHHPAPVQLPQSPRGAGSTSGSAADSPPHSHASEATTAPGAKHAELGVDSGALLPHDLLSYPGDNATPQQIAAWMGANAKRAGLPAELPVMASLVESTLHNLNYGDRDSVGFFQMRLGIWNNGPYAGYPQHPDLQIKWFIDHALEARGQDPALAQSPSTWGEWVANVEQPAAQYRYRYQLQLGTAQQLLNGVDLTPAPVPHIPVGEAALKVATQVVGGPAPGGAPGAGGPTGSGDLLQYAYGREGINLPGVPAEQFDVGMPVAKHDLRPGDAVFFADPNGFVHRVGLYVGGRRFLSAVGHGGHVEVRSLSDVRFAAEYVGARRYTESALTNPKHFARSLPTIQP